MIESFRVLIYLVLLGACIHQVAAQATNTKSQPVTNLNKPKVSRPSAPVTDSVVEANAKAKEFLERGMKREAAGQLPVAVEDLQQAIKIQPDYAQAYSALGRVYFKMRQWQKAIDNFQQAAALNTKEQQREDALQLRITSGRRQDADSPVRTNPDSGKETKTQPATKANTAPLKTSTTALIESPKEDRRNELSSASKTTTASSQNKTPQTNIAGGGGTTRTSRPTASQLPNQRTDLGPVARVAPPSSQIKQPQEANANARDAKTSAFQPGKSEQSAQSNTPLNVIKTSSESKPASETKPAVPVQKIVTPESTQSEQQKEGSTKTKWALTTQQLAAHMRALSPEFETGRPLPKVDQPGVAITPTLPKARKPQQVFTAIVELAATYDAKEATAQNMRGLLKNIGEPPESGGLPQKPEAVGTEVSLNAKPESSPLDTRNAIPKSINASTDEASLTKIYRVGSNDVLDIRISDTQGSTLFTVTPSGLIEHPLLGAPLLVTGLTAEEVRSKIENEVIRRALIENPDVAVGVREYASHSIIVSGLVQDAGTKFLRREAIPLYVVVADAQPRPEAARVTVVRNQSNQVYEIDLMRVAEMNLLVRPGDVITLHPNMTQFVYIGGEVKFPGEKTFRRGLTLTQVIISSGPTRKAKEAEIARDDGRGFLVGRRFNLKEIQSGKAVDPLLRPGDRITILR